MPDLVLTPLPASPEVMDRLEALGCIVRLAPRRHEIATAPGDAIGKTLYACDVREGGHMLLACTINQTGFARFGWHSVPEEFLLIGDSTREPLYLAVFHGTADQLQEKIDQGTISADSFTCLQLSFNDPECSFFTMNPQVPHGECVACESDHPPSFYVTEPSGTRLVTPKWKDYRLSLVT